MASPPWLTQLAVQLEQGEEPAILLSPEYEVLVANTAYLRAFGPGAEGRRCFEVSHRYTSPCDQHGESCPLAIARSTRQRARVLHVHHTPRGLEHVDVSLRPILSPDGGVLAYVETLKPVNTASPQVLAGAQVGRSRTFNHVLELALRAAPAPIPVLLLGESGTGKERMARGIHDASDRADGPFVAIACSGLSEALFESELFGHERGSFTGAHSRRIGLVEAAAGGTLFLDEIGDVPPRLQVKLLRLLEARSFRRVGATALIDADFRLICATWRDLEEMVDQGSFRRDLYYRIAAFPIRLPSLRERVEDIPLLVDAILDELGVELEVSPAGLQRLAEHPWPGNIRELRHALQRAALLSDGDRIEVEQLLLPERSVSGARGGGGWPWGDAILPLEEVERRYLRWCLQRVPGDRRALAERLGVSERTLFRRLARLREGGVGAPRDVD